MKIDDSDAIRHKMPLETKRNVPLVTAVTPTRNGYDNPVNQNNNLIYDENKLQSDDKKDGFSDSADNKNKENSKLNNAYISDIHGLDNIDITPEMMAVIDNMMSEITKLRSELDQAEKRIIFLENKGDHDPIAKCLTAAAFNKSLIKLLLLDKDNNNNSCLAILTIKNWGDIHHGMNRKSDEKVIHHMAEILSLSIKTGDILGHISDDQFAIIFTASSEEQSEIFIDEINNKFNNNPPIVSSKAVAINPQWVMLSLAGFNNADDVMQMADHQMRLSLNQ